jgi:hypothetical protein
MNDTSHSSEQPADSARQQLRERLRQLILMRETGPKRAAWHAARARLIWRLHDELRENAEQPPSNTTENHQPGAE